MEIQNFQKKILIFEFFCLGSHDIFVLALVFDIFPVLNFDNTYVGTLLRHQNIVWFA